MSNENNPKQDDGTLAFLSIPQDENNKHFNCRETTQQKLINLSFFVVDFIDGVKTKFGAERFLVKIKHPDDSPDKHGRGIDFLGFVFYHNETRLRKRIKQNLCRKVAKLAKRKKPVSEAEFKQIVASWWGWAKHSDSQYLINKLK